MLEKIDTGAMSEICLKISVLSSVSDVNPLNANPTKWSNTLKQSVGKLPTNCLSVFDHFIWIWRLKG